MTKVETLRSDLQSIYRSLEVMQEKADSCRVGVQVAEAKKDLRDAIALLGREAAKGSRSMDNR